MLRTMCGVNVLDKVRHFVPYAGSTWQIDVYEGLLEGVVLAEIELTDADKKLILPDWIGEEVTADPAYRKVKMVAARFAKSRFPDETTSDRRLPRHAGY
jgi:adenylate cyclase